MSILTKFVSGILSNFFFNKNLQLWFHLKHIPLSHHCSHKQLSISITSKHLGLIISSETVTNTTMDDFTPKTFSKDSSPQKSSPSSSGCFDCNICLDVAMDPVVTLCGHLYCWLCIYKWLQMEDRRITPRSCPVCKAALSERSLVPLYGHGTSTKRHHHQAIPIPGRPSVRHHHLHHDYSHEGELSSSSSPPSMMSSAAVGLLGEIVVAVLPWAVRNHQTGAAMTGGLYHTSPFQRAGGGSVRLRRQELQVERWLNQMWVFLFCCAILCLLWFW